MTVSECLKKLSRELSLGSDISTPELLPRETVIQKDTCTPAVRCSIAYNSKDRTSKISTKRLKIKKDVVNVCNGLLLSHEKPNEVMPHGCTLEDHTLSDRGDNRL